MLAIYCRISKEDIINPNRSICNQKDLGIQLAKKLKMPFKVYTDQNFSGSLKRIDDRPAFSEMLEDIISGKIISVFSTEQDRLERNPQIRYLFMETLKEYRIKLYSVNGEENLNDIEDEFLGDIKSLMNQYYVRLTSKKIKNVLKNNALKGKVHGIIPFGYRKSENDLMIIDEEESLIVKRIYDMSFNGLGTNKIAEIFNNEGIFTRYNKIQGNGFITITNKYTGKKTVKNRKDIKWSGKTIGGIIKGTLYKGDRKFSNKNYSCPAIIEKGFWKKVNENLQKNRNNSGKATTHKYMLKNVIECGGCGRNMYGRTRTNKKDNYYMCSGKRYKNCECKTRSINIDVLEEFIWSRFFERSELMKLLEFYFDNDNSKLNDIKNKITHKEVEVTKLQNERKNAIRLAVQGILSDVDVKSEITRIDSNIEDTQIKIFNFQEQLKIFDNSDQLLKQLKVLSRQSQVQKIPFNDKVSLINKYIKRVKINSDDDMKLYNIRIEFNVEIKAESYVMDFHKRIPYIDYLASVRILHNSHDWKENLKM